MVDDKAEAYVEVVAKKDEEAYRKSAEECPVDAIIIEE